uniref:Uncharacterized protein n=1 Tax=Oryza rufipogon TaxID=4529 RepID=A0A0E0NFF5_ORYRU
MKLSGGNEEAKPPLAEEQRDLRVSDDGEVVVAASPVGSGDDESDAYVASAVSQWMPTAVSAAVARDLLPRFLCSTWWAHLDDGESASSKATARPVAPAAFRVHVTRMRSSFPECSEAPYTAVVAACSLRSSAPPHPESPAAAAAAAAAMPTELSPKHDSSCVASGFGFSSGEISCCLLLLLQ